MKRLALCMILASAVAVLALEPKVPSDVQLISNVPYSTDTNKAHKLDIVRPKKLPNQPMPVIVFVHGGGFRSGSKEGPIKSLIPFAQKGYFCATINYRLSGEATFPAQIEDCKCAIRFLRAHAKEYNLDADHIGVWGSSAGGTLVALLGLTEGAKEFEGNGGWEKESSKVQAVCNWYGRMDFQKTADEEKAGGVTPQNMQKGGTTERLSALLGCNILENPEACKRVSPITYVSKDAPPFLTMQGDKDDVVLPNQSEAIHQALKKVGVESTLQIVKGAGHGFGLNPEIEKQIADFFNKHLRGGKSK